MEDRLNPPEWCVSDASVETHVYVTTQVRVQRGIPHAEKIIQLQLLEDSALRESIEDIVDQMREQVVTNTTLLRIVDFMFLVHAHTKRDDRQFLTVVPQYGLFAAHSRLSNVRQLPNALLCRRLENTLTTGGAQQAFLTWRMLFISTLRTACKLAIRRYAFTLRVPASYAEEKKGRFYLLDKHKRSIAKHVNALFADKLPATMQKFLGDMRFSTCTAVEPSATKYRRVQIRIEADITGGLDDETIYGSDPNNFKYLTSLYRFNYFMSEIFRTAAPIDVDKVVFVDYCDDPNSSKHAPIMLTSTGGKTTRWYQCKHFAWHMRILYCPELPNTALLVIANTIRLTTNPNKYVAMILTHDETFPAEESINMNLFLDWMDSAQFVPPTSNAPVMEFYEMCKKPPKEQFFKTVQANLYQDCQAETIRPAFLDANTVSVAVQGFELLMSAILYSRETGDAMSALVTVHNSRSDAISLTCHMYAMHSYTADLSLFQSSRYPIAICLTDLRPASSFEYLCHTLFNAPDRVMFIRTIFAGDQCVALDVQIDYNPNSDGIFMRITPTEASIIRSPYKQLSTTFATPVTDLFDQITSDKSAAEMHTKHSFIELLKCESLETLEYSRQRGEFYNTLNLGTARFQLYEGESWSGTTVQCTHERVAPLWALHLHNMLTKPDSQFGEVIKKLCLQYDGSDTLDKRTPLLQFVHGIVRSGYMDTQCPQILQFLLMNRRYKHLHGELGRPDLDMVEWMDRGRIDVLVRDAQRATRASRPDIEGHAPGMHAINYTFTLQDGSQKESKLKWFGLVIVDDDGKQTELTHPHMAGLARVGDPQHVPTDVLLPQLRQNVKTLTNLSKSNDTYTSLLRHAKLVINAAIYQNTTPSLKRVERHERVVEVAAAARKPKVKTRPARRQPAEIRPLLQPENVIVCYIKDTNGTIIPLTNDINGVTTMTRVLSDWNGREIPITTSKKIIAGVLHDAGNRKIGGGLSSKKNAVPASFGAPGGSQLWHTTRAKGEYTMFGYTDSTRDNKPVLVSVAQHTDLEDRSQTSTYNPILTWNDLKNHKAIKLTNAFVDTDSYMGGAH